MPPKRRSMRPRSRGSSGLFSDAFGVRTRKADDWFDPVLNVDTKLFVDPFLVFKDSHREWRDAHPELIRYFDSCFTLIARAGGRQESLHFKKALSLLRFPEPKEFCLGYVQHGTAGAGGGLGHARAMADAIADAIARGIRHPEHFEDLGIFNEGIGPDRISDMTCNVLRPRFVRYTQAIARRHRVRMARFALERAEFDSARKRWLTRTVLLPKNPHTGGPVLLVPARFLRDLPALNARDWWDSSEASQLRDDLSIDVLQRVDKKTIIDLARQHPDAVNRWVKARAQDRVPPYDLLRDPNGVYSWASATSKYASQHPVRLSNPETLADFAKTIEVVIEQYRLFIEERGGWRLLWNDDGSEKPEEAAQLAFLGLSRAYCEANDIVLDREVNLGRGPVDFKFSTGYASRALLEMKKLHNGKFWNGLLKQLPSYMLSDGCSTGWFVAIQYRSTKKSRPRLKQLRAVDLSKLSGTVRVVTIDGRPKKSASKLN